ncbi:MAG: YopX family protein [Blautia sp.]|nr:YopX family protein [Blautia sp.]
MREILFRAKRKNNGEWVDGYVTRICHSNGNEVKSYYFNARDELGFVAECVVDADTVGQYTGLTDKNGKKIFEGDIVKCGGNLVVTWNEKSAGWCLTKEGWAYKHFFGEACEPKDCEVIGNIFDSPGLIGGAG